MPLPGDVDVVLASELMEAARAVQRGLVTPDRTTLIASTHRVYSIAEKTALGDGRVDGAALLAHAKRRGGALRRASTWPRAAEESGSVISAVLFGALAGTGVLPFARPRSRRRSRAAASASRASLEAFDAGFARALGRDATPASARAASVSDGSELAAPSAATASPHADAPSPATRVAAARSGVAALLERIGPGFPVDAQRDRCVEGVRRLIDYQDLAYARLYLDRLARIAPPRPHGAAARCWPRPRAISRSG